MSPSPTFSSTAAMNQKGKEIYNIIVQMSMFIKENWLKFDMKTLHMNISRNKIQIYG